MLFEVQLQSGQKVLVPISGDVNTDAVTDNDMHPVTSNAVYDALKEVSIIGEVKRTVSDNVPNGYIDCTVYDEIDYHVEQITFSPTVNKIENNTRNTSDLWLFTESGAYIYTKSTNTIGNKVTDLSPSNENITSAYINYSDSYYRNSVIGTTTGVFFKQSTSAFPQMLSGVEVYNICYTYNISRYFYSNYMWVYCTSGGVYGVYSPNNTPERFNNNISKCYTAKREDYYNQFSYFGTDNGVVYYDQSWGEWGTITGTTGYNVTEILIFSSTVLYFGTKEGYIIKINYNGNTFTYDSATKVCDGAITYIQKVDTSYYIFTEDGLYVTTDFVTYTKELPNKCKTGYMDYVNNVLYAYFANEDGLFRHVIGSTSIVTMHFKALNKSDYPDLYTEIGDKYNSHIQDIPATQFAIPLLEDEEKLYRYIMKV